MIRASGMSIKGSLTGFNIQDFSAKNALNRPACCKVLWFRPVLLQDSDATGAYMLTGNIQTLTKRKDLRCENWSVVRPIPPHPENCTCCLFWPQHSFSPKRTKTRRNLIFTNILSAWVLHKNVQFPSPSWVSGVCPPTVFSQGWAVSLGQWRLSFRL